MKGLSAVLATVLIVVITVAIIGLAYGWAVGLFKIIEEPQFTFTDYKNMCEKNNCEAFQSVQSTGYKDNIYYSCRCLSGNEFKTLWFVE